jgi:hypothetical protein
LRTVTEARLIPLVPDLLWPAASSARPATRAKCSQTRGTSAQSLFLSKVL